MAIKQPKLRIVIYKWRPLAGWYDEVQGKSFYPLTRGEMKQVRDRLRSLADKIEDRIGKEEFAEWEDKKCRCKICGSPTKQLKTTEGDPEGIRHDRICTNPKCKRKHGMTKAHFFAFHLYPVKGKKPIEAP
jgi:hypothetical protein